MSEVIDAQVVDMPTFTTTGTTAVTTTELKEQAF